MRKLNKRILAFVLAAVLVIGTAMNVLAADSLVGSGWWTDTQTSTPQTLVDGGTVTFRVSITSDTIAEGEYAAFCVEATDGTNYFTGTSDGDCWGAGTDLDADAESAVVGGSYIVTISRDGNYFEADIVDANTGSPMFRDPMYLYDTADFGETTCYIMSQVGDLTVEVLSVEGPLTEKLTGSGWWTDCETSTAVSLEDGEAVSFDVVISSDTLADGDYAAFCVEANDGTNYFTGTSDGDCWGAGTDTDVESVGVVVGGSYTVLIERTGNNFTATIRDSSTMEFIVSSMSLEGTTDFGTTVCYIMSQVGDLTVTSLQPLEINVADDSSDEDETTTTADEEAGTTVVEDETTAVEDETTTATVEGESITYTVTYNEEVASGDADDATFTTFASTKTGEITLSGDFLLTYEFYNYGDLDGSSAASLSTDSPFYWNNFVVEMVGNGVYVDVRADNAGWLYGQGADDSITFSVDTTDYDWENWVAEMTAGSYCSVYVEKVGTTITVTMATVDCLFIATAEVAAYTDDCELTIYLIGEQCTLTDVTYTAEKIVTEEKTLTFSEVVPVTVDDVYDADMNPYNIAWNADYELSADQLAELAELFAGDFSTDAFEVTVTNDDGTDYEFEDGEKAYLCFEISAEASYGNILFLAYTEDGWQVAESDYVDEDGRYYVLFSSFASSTPMVILAGNAIATSSTPSSSSEDEPTTTVEDATTATPTDSSSPTTSDTSVWMYIALLAGAAVVISVFAKKRVTE